MKQVVLGIIGLGHQGKVHLSNAFHIGSAKVLAVADVSERALSLAKKRGVKEVYKSYEALLENDDIEAVIISLPNFLHLEACKKAAEAGKHIFLEKPLARNIREGEEILQYIKKYNVKCMVNFPLRFNSVIREIHEKVASGFFGEIEIVDATYVGSGPFFPRSDRVGPSAVPSWWFDKESVGGGALLDLGSHLIDLLSWYFGEAEVIESHLGYIFGLELEDLAICTLKFKSGPIATVKTGWFSKGHIVSIHLCGTAGNIWKRISPQTTLGNIWKDIEKKIGSRNHDPSYSALDYFVKCLKKDVNPQPSVEEALKCMHVISDAYEKALKTGRKYRKEVQF